MANSEDIAVLRGFWGNGVPQKRILASDSNSNPTYIAIGPRGAATSSPNWLVEKLVWDANGNYQYSLHSDFNQIADNYTSLDYK